MLIAQITDTHVVAAGARAYQNIVDTNAMMAKAVDRLNALDPRPDLVVITGDLTDHGTPVEYAELRLQLARLDIPFYLAIGNHDDRATMLAELDYEHLATARPFVQYAVDHLPVRLIVLDSMNDDHHLGDFCDARLDWFKARLAEHTDKPTVVAMHHPPFNTGIVTMDMKGPGWADGIVAAIEQRPNVVRVLCGHVHRSIQTQVGGAIANICPSTAHQVTLDLAAGMPSLARMDAFFEMEPPGFQLHLWDGARMITHTAAVEQFRQFSPISREMMAAMAARGVGGGQDRLKKDLVF